MSPPALKDCSKGSEFERISKELGIDNNSPSDDFSINEKDLDENYNNNTYNDEEYQQIENQCQEESSEQDSNRHNNLKNYYLKNSYYLSGITERSVEESEYLQSYEGVNKQFENERESKRLKVSKYS